MADRDPPPRRRARVAAWDVICTVATVAVLVTAAAATRLPTVLFGFLADVCPADNCAPVPLGVDVWIYPVVWGGVGAACAAVVLGPVVSVVKGWHLFFWPIIAMALVVVSAAAGAAITSFSEHYWR
ncbi:hypothetical protein [Mycobacterium sp.]